MKPSLRLGRIAGVPVGVHWSVVVILALITDILATAVLPASATDASKLACWLVAGFVSVAFLASLLAHELSHAAVARRYGLEVKGITLWALGGVAQLESMPRDPGSDLRVALAGPLASVVCSVLAFGGMLAAEAAGAARVVSAGFGWLALTNVVLAGFNLLPGAPLDGGRVLRALVWRRTGDRTRAAITATQVGRATGLTLALLGVVEVLATGDMIGGIWLMLVGWFLMGAATVEMQAVATEHSLGAMTVGEAMDRDLTWLPAYQTIGVAAHRAVEAGADICPVCDVDGVPVGLVGVDQLVRLVRAGRGDMRVTAVTAPITERMRAVPDELLSAALLRAGTPPLVVFDDGSLVGLVTAARVTLAMRRILVGETSPAPV